MFLIPTSASDEQPVHNSSLISALHPPLIVCQVKSSHISAPVSYTFSSTIFLPTSPFLSFLSVQDDHETNAETFVEIKPVSTNQHSPEHSPTSKDIQLSR